MSSPPKLDKKMLDCNFDDSKKQKLSLPAKTEKKAIESYYVPEKRKSPTKKQEIGLIEIKTDLKASSNNRSRSPNREHNVSLNKQFVSFK